jgi:thioredoxin 1
MATLLNDGNFAQETGTGTVLVDFFAEWCGPCKLLLPIFEELAPEYEGKIKFVKVNVDESANTAQQFGVLSIPTLVVLKDGQEVDRMTGFQTADVLRGKLGQYA